MVGIVAPADATEAHAHYARMVEHLPAGAVYVKDDRLTMNRAAEEITGYGRDELQTRDVWSAALFADRAHEVHQIYLADREHGFQRRSPTFAIRRKDGQERYVEFAAYQFEDAEVWLMHDVTDRQRAEQALRDSEDYLRGILDTAADGIITIDTAGSIQSLNRAAERMFGYTAAEVIGQNVRVLMPPPYSEEHDGYLARHLETGEARVIGIRHEVVALRKNGKTFPMDLVVSAVGRRGCFTGIIRDLSERKTMERRLADSAVEERAHLARELHDEIGGQVTGIGMLAQTLHSQLAKEGSPLAARAHDLVQSVDDCHTRLRALSRGLMPVEALPEGLMVALERLAEQTADAHDITCRFVCHPPVYVVDAPVSAHLFRIAQEAVNNAVRHAGPQHVTIALTRDRDHLKLVVTDDGRGFGTIPRDHAGLGLVSMRQRAQLLGGEASVESERGRGTVVKCQVLLTGDDET